MKKKIKVPAKTKALSKISVTPANYYAFLEEIKKRIQTTQLKTAVTVNEKLIKLYWSIGKDIVEKQEKEGWGSKLIEKFGKDLQKEFPGVEGFSRTNIFRMRAFYLAYAIVPQSVGQFEDLPIFRIPWGHNAVLIERIKDIKVRLWYVQQTLEHGWSRHLLEMWIDSHLYKRQGKAITNFKTSLPNPQSDLAEQTLKNPYSFDFLTLHKEAVEKDIEKGLIAHIQQFLLELGQGFAFVGRQHPLHIEDQDYYIDLLFYHLKLRCYVVIELKARPFNPGDAGQINFYLSAIDDLLKHPTDNPTIGILLYHDAKNAGKKPKKIQVEYALRDIKKPIGVAQFKTTIVNALPKQFKGNLPTVQELEAELERKNARKK